MADTIVRYHGRDFSSDEIKRIRDLIEGRPELSRLELSRQVCDELDWKKPDGARKEMACRVAMLRMQRDGLIELPAARTADTNRVRRPPVATKQTDPELPVSGWAGELGALEFEIVDQAAGRRKSQIWNEFIERYHYLGYKPLTGAQIRYFVYGQGRLLALLGFGAAAWALASRDKFIGWTREERESRLALITNNARFLILPWVQVKNLASRILAQAARRIPMDWQVRYGYQPALLETCVEQGRAGTCYLAANWLKLGETQGRGKLDQTHTQVLSIKRVFVYPLRREFREILRGGHCEAVDRSDHQQENFLAREPRTDSDDVPGTIR